MNAVKIRKIRNINGLVPSKYGSEIMTNVVANFSKPYIHLSLKILLYTFAQRLSLLDLIGFIPR